MAACCMPAVASIVEARWALRHSKARASVTARCVPSSSQLEKDVEKPLPVVAVAAKDELERTYQQNGALATQSADDEAALGMLLQHLPF